jgi:hypothetical protein
MDRPLGHPAAAALIGEGKGVLEDKLPVGQRTKGFHPPSTNSGLLE